MMVLPEYNESANQVVLDTITAPSGNEYLFVLDESEQKISFVTKNKRAIKDFKDFVDEHPYMSGIAVKVGVDAIDNYRNFNKRAMTRFFATNKIEKDLYKKVAQDLVKTGKYSIHKNGLRIKNGWLWELKRK